MIYFISAVIGVLLGEKFIFNFYILMFFIVLNFLLLYFIPKKQIKRILLFSLIFIISFFITNINAREIYFNNENIEDVFLVDNILGNNRYILKNKNNKVKFTTYTKEKLKYNDELLINGNVKTFEKDMNSCGINIYKIKKSKGISYKLKIRKIEKFRTKRYLKYLQNKFIYHTEKTFKKYLKKDNCNLMSSIILANKNYMKEDEINLFNNAGISHILALSGLHIVIIACFFDLIFKIFKFSKIIRRIISLIIVLMYIYFVGAPIGAIRSYIMTLCLYMSIDFKFKYNSLNALCLSAIINIFINPYCIYSFSFIYSYISVFSIIIFYKRIRNYFPTNYILDSIILTFSVGILLFPVNEYFFYNFSLLGFVSNLVLIPIYTLAIILSFIMMIFSFLAFIIAPFLNLILDLSIYIINLINKISFLNISLKVFTLNYLVVYYVIIFVIVKRRELKWISNFKNIIYIYSLVSILLISANILYDSSFMKLKFLYVDQGDCALIEYKNKNYLVDTGGCYLENYSPGKIYTLNYLKKHGIYNIDGLFISHFDSDHIEGIFDLMDYLNIKNIYISYIEKNDILEEILNRNYKVYLLKEKDIVNLSKDAKFKVVSDASKYITDNDKSLVLSLNFNGYKTLFTGDISSEVEDNIRGKYDILKVSHHGSKFSTSKEFLNNIDPKFSVISCGIDNMYNHPSNIVINNLRENKVKTYITARDGEINCSIKNRIEFSSFLSKKINYDFYLYFIISIIIISFLVYKMRYLWITKMCIEKF